MRSRRYTIYIWESPRAEPAYRHAAMKDFYLNFELAFFQGAKTFPGFLERSRTKVLSVTLFFIGPALAVPLIMLPRVVRDRRTRFLIVTGGVVAAGLAVNVSFAPHYLAPFTAGILAILLQAMRHLRVWPPGGQRSGLFLVRASLVICALLAGVRLIAVPLGLVGPWPSICMWY